MAIISTMTILELSTALGIVIAGIAGLLKASACKKIQCSIIKGCICEREIMEEPTNAGLLRSSKCRKIECGILKGIVCERDIEEEDIIATPKNDFDRALQSKSNAILNGEKNKESEDQNENQTKTKAITNPKSSH